MFCIHSCGEISAARPAGRYSSPPARPPTVSCEKTLPFLPFGRGTACKINALFVRSKAPFATAGFEHTELLLKLFVESTTQPDWVPMRPADAAVGTRIVNFQEAADRGEFEQGEVTAVAAANGGSLMLSVTWDASGSQSLVPAAELNRTFTVTAKSNPSLTSDLNSFVLRRRPSGCVSESWPASLPAATGPSHRRTSRTISAA